MKGHRVRKLVYYIASTLDGFIAGPDATDPTGPDGFWPIPEDYLQHIVAEYPETLPAPARKALSVTGDGRHFDTVVAGRRTYEQGLQAGLANAYPHLRYVVFSRTLSESPDPAVELVGRDPVATMRHLKQQDGKDIWLLGGAELAGALYAEIDRLIIKLSPLTIGSGIPLFAHQTFDLARWELLDHTALTSGFVFLRYARSTSGD